MITHVNNKKTWVYAKTPFAEGWIDIRDIAYTGPKFLKEFYSHKTFIAITQEDVALYNQWNHYLFSANIGTLFKLIKKTKKHYIAGVPSASKKRYAYFKYIKINKTEAHLQPVKLNYKNLSNLHYKSKDFFY